MPVAVPRTARRDWAFLGLMAFTALLFFRPQDQLPALGSLRLAEIAALVGLAGLFFGRLGRGLPVTRVTPELAGVVALGGVILLLAPFSIWMGGAIATFTDLYGKSRPDLPADAQHVEHHEADRAGHVADRPGARLHLVSRGVRLCARDESDRKRPRAGGNRRHVPEPERPGAQPRGGTATGRGAGPSSEVHVSPDGGTGVCRGYGGRHRSDTLAQRIGWALGS
jgi:hypothetical protein